MTRIVAIDDEPQILRALRAGLSGHGFEVTTATTAEEGLDAVATESPECVIVDLGLPDMDGAEVIKRVRSWSEVPVVVLTVRDAVSDKIAALDTGADDYVSKPFAMDELVARMRAAIRRVHPPDPTGSTVTFGDLSVDLGRTLVTVPGGPVRLTPKEYALLEAFVTNPGKLLTHGWLLRKVWGRGYGQESHYVRIFVRQLRQKIGDDAGSPRYISTEPGMGYRWIAEPDG